MSRGEVRRVGAWRRLQSNPEVLNAYEALMSSVQVLSESRALSSLMITSTRPEEGKSTVAVTLGLTMMRAGKNVLIIDADLRKPQIHRALQIENSRGFAEVLNATAGVHDVIQVVPIADERTGNSRALSVITRGRSDSAGGLASAKVKLKEIIHGVTKLYDLVLVDAPPTLAVSDALLLAPVVDGVLLVVNSGTVTERDARRAKERLQASGAQVIGVALNRFDEKRHGSSFHPYRSYYTPDAT